MLIGSSSLTCNYDYYNIIPSTEYLPPPPPVHLNIRFISNKRGMTSFIIRHSFLRAAIKFSYTITSWWLSPPAMKVIHINSSTGSIRDENDFMNSNSEAERTFHKDIKVVEAFITPTLNGIEFPLKSSLKTSK